MVLGIMISKQCNFHCGHCMVNSSHKYSWMEDGVLNKFYELVEYNRPDDVYILGGEPFLHIEKIEEMVSIIKKTVIELRFLQMEVFCSMMIFQNA